jgi:hypothetical protein
MIGHRYLKPALVALMALAAPSSAALAAAPSVTTATPASGTARVWFLRPSSLVNPSAGAAPTIYANGSPVGSIPANSEFYRDFAPGAYRFSVRPYGLPTGAIDTVQLTPGSQTYLEVQWVPTWEEGYPGGDRSDSHSFFILNLSPQLAQAYQPSLTQLANN